MKNLFYLLLLVCINPHLIAQTYDTLALKVGEVYNFNVGDEFHYYNQYSSNDEYIIKVVLSKSYSSNNDTIFYTYLLNGVDTSYESITNLDAYIVTQNDTTYGDTDETFSHQVEFATNPLLYNGLRTNLVSDDVLYFDTGYGKDTLYIEGCGMVANHWEHDGLWLWGAHSNNSLVYFKKGNQTWGYPVFLPPCTGIQAIPETTITIGEAFDFDIGDQFQFIKTNHASSNSHYYTKRVVINKQFNVSNNSISYTYLDSVRYMSNMGLDTNYVEINNQTIFNLNSTAFEYWDSIQTGLFLENSYLTTCMDSCQTLTNNIVRIQQTISSMRYAAILFIKGCGAYTTNKQYYAYDLPYGQTEQLLFYHKANGSCGESLPFYTFVAPFVSSNSINYLSVSPNPANNQVQIGLPATANHQNATLQITDLQGRVVKTITYTTASFGGGKGEASTHDLPNGMYLISYTQQGLLIGRAKVVVQR